MSELIDNRPYKVENFKMVFTKFGNRIVVKISEGETKFDVFLPERISASFVEKQSLISDANEQAEKGLWMIVSGQGKSKAVEWRTSI